MVEGVFASLREAAPHFGLFADARYAPISAEVARRTLMVVLSTDLAYGTQAIGRNRAERFVRTFAEMARLDEPPTLCYTSEVDPPWYVESSWRTYHPATGATFDAGVLVIARDRCACLWVEDED